MMPIQICPRCHQPFNSALSPCRVCGFSPANFIQDSEPFEPHNDSPDHLHLENPYTDNQPEIQRFLEECSHNIEEILNLRHHPLWQYQKIWALYRKIKKRARS
jgi:hypothetical protein